MRIKEQLYALCVAFADTRIASSREAIAAAQASANEETKSSSGDKYETGRAMAQLEIENNTRHLAVAKQLKQTLSRLNMTSSTTVVQPGSLVVTSQGTYFISIGAGMLTLEGKQYIAVSADSPIASQLIGRRAGDTFEFNKKRFSVEQIV